MQNILIQMAVLIGCGLLWRRLHPGGLAADQIRAALTASVYYVFLPALVLNLLWQAPLAVTSFYIAGLAASGVLLSLLLTWLVYRIRPPANHVMGALLLASAWPNATYLGLPVLEAVLGDFGRRIAIQYDLFACTPLLLTVGVLVARYYGQGMRQAGVISNLLSVPALWAATAGVTMNSLGITEPVNLAASLQLLAQAVVPLMLLSLGMSLRWDTLRWKRLPQILPVLVLQLFLMPLLVWALSQLVISDGRLQLAIVLEAAMPTMLLGLVFCDRYGLDGATFAAAAALTTALSFATLPFWHSVLMH